MNSKENILVSIIVCCYNEEKYIAKCINSLLCQTNLSGNIEILVIDGLSEDNTKTILRKMMLVDSRIKLFENTLKVKPPAVNIGFRESKGKYVAICDAHTEYDSNYLISCLRIFHSNSDVWCVGGPIISIGETSFGKANAIAMSSPIGVGNAKHRFPDYEGFAEMACFPVFRREVISKVGYYDEFFIINHDDEYCYRLRQERGKVFLTTNAKSYYYVRNSFVDLFKQYFNYGLWQIAFLKKHKIPISLRQLIPFSFFTIVFILMILGIIFKNFIVSISLPIIYIGILFVYSLSLLKKHEFKVALKFPFAVITLHFSYAIGFLFG